VTNIRSKGFGLFHQSVLALDHWIGQSSSVGRKMSLSTTSLVKKLFDHFTQLMRVLLLALLLCIARCWDKFASEDSESDTATLFATKSSDGTAKKDKSESYYIRAIIGGGVSVVLILSIAVVAMVWCLKKGNTDGGSGSSSSDKKSDDLLLGLEYTT